MDLLLSGQRLLSSALGQAPRREGAQAEDQKHLQLAFFTGWWRRVLSTVCCFFSIISSEAVRSPLPLVQMLGRKLWKLKPTSQFQCLSDFAVSDMREPFIRSIGVSQDRVNIKISLIYWRT